MSDFDTASLGDILRAERQRQNKDLAKMAVETKICCNILQALERNQFDVIPGGSYRSHFLRQYAHALGLDETEAVAAFHQQYEEPELPLPTPPKRSRSWRVLELGWVLTTAAAVLGVYKIAESLHTTPPWKETGIMAQLAPPRAPAKTMTAATASVSAAGSADRSSAENSSADNSSADKSATGSADKNAATDAPVRVALTATEPVWLSVKCDGAPSYTGTLLGPETKTFEASNAVTVLIGNAGGVTISLNGKPLGPVGGHGETRSLELTSSGVRGLPRPSAKTIDFAPKLEKPD
ncbi:MAG: RodZ domain-containing protein [Bryobacteraceae bacterium]|jgi:cytoskeleton protein RodZ